MTNFIKEELDKFDEEFGGQKFVYANENTIKDWVTASHLRLLERVKSRIEKIRDEIEEINGTSKWSSSYNDCIAIINELKSIE